MVDDNLYSLLFCSFEATARNMVLFLHLLFNLLYRLMVLESICSFFGTWASPLPMDLPWAAKAA
jgi:hypothetical protein